MKRILIVDDSTFMRTTIKILLTRLGHTVVGEAGNGNAAIEEYKKLHPDVVTLDITMQGMSGLETLREIVKYDSAAKIVMVTAMGQEPIIREAIDSGAKGFLLKPFKEELVVSTLARL